MYDPWIISIISIMITFMAQPAIYIIFKKIASLSGAFSGIYLVITEYEKSNKILIEFIDCKHVSSGVYGEIKSFGLAEVEHGEIIDFFESKGSYKFDGFVDERVMAISYKTKNKREKSSGNMTIRADASGKILYGIWTGFEEIEVSSGACHWFLMERNIINKGVDEIVNEVKKCLPKIFKSKDRKNLLELINSSFGEFDGVGFAGAFTHRHSAYMNVLHETKCFDIITMTRARDLKRLNWKRNVDSEIRTISWEKYNNITATIFNDLKKISEKRKKLIDDGCEQEQEKTANNDKK